MERIDLMTVARAVLSLLAVVVMAVAVSGCEATFPIGAEAAYGEAYVGYRLPAVRTFSTYNIFGSEELYGRTLGDK